VTTPPPTPTTPAHPLRGTLLVLLSAACFGTTLIFTQRALDGGAQLPSLLAYRYVMGAALLLMLAGGPGPVLGVGSRKWPLLLLGGSAQASIAALSAFAITLIPPASVAFLFYTYPTWVAVLAIIRRTEPVDTNKALALVLSLAGIVTIVGNPFATQLNPVGIGLSLLCALVYALLIPWLGTMQAGLKPASAMTWIAGGAAVWFVIGALVLRAPLGAPSSALLLNAAFLAIFPTAIAFVAFVRGLSELGPVRTSIVSTVEPFWTALLAGLWLGQAVGPRTWIGGAMIAAAMVVLQRKPASA
jgi:drug/metabolite transporter (DMT)-like permease